MSPRPTPTVSCQMHQSVVTCTQTGMLATEFCPSTTTTGVVVIPNGHPLSAYVNDSQYGPVIAEYLGTANSLGYCTLHTSYETSTGGGWSRWRLYRRFHRKLAGT